MTTFERVRKLLVETLAVAPDEVTPQTAIHHLVGRRLEKEITPQSTFVDDLGADSLDMVEIIMALEEEFDIEVSDEAANLLKTTTVQQIVAYIDRESRR